MIHLNTNADAVVGRIDHGLIMAWRLNPVRYRSLCDLRSCRSSENREVTTKSMWIACIRYRLTFLAVVMPGIFTICTFLSGIHQCLIGKQLGNPLLLTDCIDLIDDLLTDLIHT